MELDITKTNYLHVPLIEEYYALEEILALYVSMGMGKTQEKRDLYEIIFDRFQPFSKIKDIEENIKVLNHTVFLHKKKLKKIPNSFPEDKIRNLHSEGFKLLGLSIPFNVEELKKAYIHALKKYHPDVGGNKNDMKKINDAYLLYRNFLDFENYIKNNGTRASYFDINDGESYYSNIYIGTMFWYIDSWGLNEAYHLLTYLLDHGLNLENCNERILYYVQLLAERLTVINKNDIAKDLYYKIRPRIRGYSLEKLWNLIQGKEKLRVSIMDRIQAEYAFKNNVIAEKRYLDAVKRFSKKEQERDVSKKFLADWLENNSFVHLPFDEKLEYKQVNDFVPYIDSFANKNIYTTSKAQQNEYYFTFYIKPTIKLINKYLYFRVYSYIASLMEYKEKKSYLSDIIDECHFLLKLYNHDPKEQTNQNLIRLIYPFVEDLTKWLNVGEENHKENYNDLLEKYKDTLNMEKFENPYAYAPWTDKKKPLRGHMSRKEVFDELNEQYNSHELFKELMESFTIDDFNGVGKKLCSEEFGRNLDLASELFNLALEYEYVNLDTLSLLEIIENIASSNILNDKEWAKDIYLKVQNDIEEYPDDLVKCVKLITKEEYLNDKNWGKEVIQKTLDKTDQAEYLISVADIVAASDGLNDEVWARELCQTAQKTADGLFDYLLLANCLANKDGINDKEWAKDNYILAAKECKGSGCIEMVAENAMNSLKDIEFSNKIKNITPKKVETTTVKFTIYGGKDDKSDQIKNIVEDNHYYELEVASGDEIEEVVRNILNDKNFIKDVIYDKWEKILDPKQDDPGEYDSMLYINELIYEGKTYNKDDQIGSYGDDLFFTSTMLFDMENETMICIGI